MKIALRSLAANRAFQGVGIAESLRDVQCLFSLVPNAHAREFLASYAEAWVEATDLFSHKLTCWDPATGLSNRQHFERRVYELRDELTTREVPYLLVSLGHPLFNDDFKKTVEISAKIGQLCKIYFPGHIATYSANRLVVLVRTESYSGAQVNYFERELSSALKRGQRQSERLEVRTRPVPLATFELGELFRDLWN